MTQYVGCDHARTLLEGLVDGELSMAEQLAVESHLRWCETCAFRVEDMRTIGAALRAQPASRPVDEEDGTLTAMTEGLVMRLRAERAQSLSSRIRDMLSDNRLLWPALGATSAVLLCVAATMSVLHASKTQSRESLAGLISEIGAPGTEKWPLRPADNGVSIPELNVDDSVRAGGTLEQMPEDDVIYTIRTVMGRDGTISNYELLLSDDSPAVNRAAAARAAAQEVALLNAVRATRFVPAQTPLGQAVAVDMVWVLAKTTAVIAPEPLRRSASVERPREAAKPSPREPVGPPVSGHPEQPRRSTPA